MPLVPLTKDGANRETVEEMFTDLQQAGKLDLLQIGQMIAALAANANMFVDDFLLFDVAKPITDASHLEIEKSTINGKAYPETDTIAMKVFFGGGILS